MGDIGAKNSGIVAATASFWYMKCAILFLERFGNFRSFRVYDFTGLSGE